MDVMTHDATLATAVVEQAAAGDTIAFTRLVAAHHAHMMRVAYVVTGGRQDLADDAVQAAWTVAWRKLPSVRDPERVGAWLVAIAANEARQLCRRQRTVAVHQLVLDDAGHDGDRRVELRDDEAHDPATHADALDLAAAIGCLNADERRLLALRYEAGLDSGEIGRLIGRPAATVRWRLARVVARLRKELDDA